MLHIEFGPPHTQPCHCCGENVTRLTRFVSQDGEGLAYYYALLETHADEPLSAKLLVVMCEWDAEGDHIVRKTGFPLRMWDDGESLNVSLMEQHECPWEALPGVQILGRAQSLTHPLKAEVFHISDHIALEDHEVIGFLQGHA
ncbi:hypothetical protein CO614_06045 [Lysobacteraceae bacterium NML120232]|nr:hypothetical protein CO614_06045 [Xanthomonadaceae bacterium NML120232]